jgi:beta-glucosidase
MSPAQLRSVLFASLAIGLSLVATADTGDKPWMNTALDADRRADLVIAQMTLEEKQTLVFGYFGTDAPWKKYTIAPEALEGSAGYVPGIPRLGIPPQWIADAGIGVATQGGAKQKRERTSLPSGMATAATWDPELARRAGAMIGSEARSTGFNVMLAGGVNLVREPRNGPQFRVRRRGPAAGRRHRRRADRGHRIQSHCLDHQALRAQRPGNRPQHRQRGHGQGAGAHVRPAGFPDRHGTRRPGLGDVLL